MTKKVWEDAVSIILVMQHKQLFRNDCHQSRLDRILLNHVAFFACECGSQVSSPFHASGTDQRYHATGGTGYDQEVHEHARQDPRQA